MWLTRQSVHCNCKLASFLRSSTNLTKDHSDHEELPRAYVVLKSEHKSASTERDIEKWMAGRVAKHKQLSGGVVFIEEVPKSPSGKIQRKELREWAKKDAEGWQKRRDGARL
jgi:4-coumarate--CoA ligase